MELAREYFKVGRRERRKYQAQKNSSTIELAEYIREQEHKNPEIKDNHITTLVSAVVKDDLETQPKPQSSVRSEPTEVVKQKDNEVKTPSQTPAKPMKINLGLAALGGLALWSMPEVRGLLQHHWRGETHKKDWLGYNESRFRK